MALIVLVVGDLSGVHIFATSILIRMSFYRICGRAGISALPAVFLFRTCSACCSII